MRTIIKRLDQFQDYILLGILFQKDAKRAHRSNVKEAVFHIHEIAKNVSVQVDTAEPGVMKGRMVVEEPL